MSDAEDIFGGLACAAFCGICCAVAAEEDKKERELIAQIDAKAVSDPAARKGGRQQPIQVNPVAVTTFSTPTPQSGSGRSATMGRQVPPPARQQSSGRSIR